MHPYFHPSTILVVDDDPLYVESFKFHFGGDFPCVSYTQPERAIEHLLSQYGSGRDPTTPAGIRGTLLGAQHAQVPVGAPQDVTAIPALVGDESRFRRISVLVVDYDMPSMTGVQLCRAVRNLPVRKLLLTGKAGLDTAISAFNEGVIDIFLTKHDPEIEKTLPRHLTKLQDEFFKIITQGTRPAASNDDLAFLSVPAVGDTFAGLLKSQRINEYYLLQSPAGMLMINEAGKPQLMLLANVEGLRAHREIAQDNGAPAELVDLLASGRVLPQFPTESGFYEPDLAGSWSRHIFPATRIDCSPAWYYTLVKPEQVTGGLPRSIVTYADFDEAQDAARVPN